ncbi:MAG: DUF1007 family protein [Campylobacterales bacterium]
MRLGILLLGLWPLWAWGCALCQGYDAVIFPRLQVEANATHLQKLHIHWPFSQSLTGRIVSNFDHNQNGKLDPAEERALLQAWEAELTATGFYLILEHDGAAIAVKNPTGRRFEITEGHGSYRFTVPLERPLFDGSVLRLRFYEPKRTLSFFFDRQTLEALKTEGWLVDDNLASFPHTLQLTFKAGAAPAAAPAPLSAAPKADGGLSGAIKAAFDRLKAHFETLREGGDAQVFWSLIAFAFIYGLLHAAGPGHGKTVVAGYFFATGGGWKKAGLMALSIGAVHVFSALILTAVLLFALQVVFSTALGDAEMWLSKLSGLIIVLIALHLLYKRRRAQPKVSFSAHPPACGCGGCGAAGRSRDLGVVLAAGIIPCPGTVTIFLFALSMGLYFTGLAAAIAMSLGMGLIIWLSAAIGGGLKRAASTRLSRAVAALELLSIVLIASLGILLLLG